MKMGIGIGWPNASASSTPVLRSGWFQVIYQCGSGPVVGIYTNYQTSVNWVHGDYVYYINKDTRVQLGILYDADPGGEQYTVEGPVYNSCQI